MYASPSHRYSRTNYYAQSYSPPSKFHSYEDAQSSHHGHNQGHGHGHSHSQARQYYGQHSPPMKTYQPHHRFASSSSSSASSAATAYMDYGSEGTTYYHSGSSTASSSSQDGYYGDDLDDFDDYRVGDPEMSTVPMVPTPIALSLFEHGKKPSGRVVLTSNHQTIEFFAGVVNMHVPSTTQQVYSSSH